MEHIENPGDPVGSVRPETGSDKKIMPSRHGVEYVARGTDDERGENRMGR